MIIKASGRKVLKNRIRRLEFKQIEKTLHPTPRHYGFEIAHEHLKTGKIAFCLWDIMKDKQATGVRLIFPRNWVSRHNGEKDFYPLYEKEWADLWR